VRTPAAPRKRSASASATAHSAPRARLTPAEQVSCTCRRLPAPPADAFEAAPDEVLLIMLRQLPLDTLLRCGALGVAAGVARFTTTTPRT
jgi:hypothetical protein